MKVFTTFGSLGGSSEGYKRLGFEVVAYNEIDKKFYDFYTKKNNPKYGFNCDIRDLLNMDLPEDLYNIDILDGSPPCTLFSVANLKADGYKGVLKKFKEGQKIQLLDDLVEIYFKLILKINPKIFVFENVLGITSKKNLPYLERIKSMVRDKYDFVETVQDSFLLGLPQIRKRYFIFGISKEYRNNIPMVIPNLETKDKKYFKDISDDTDHSESKTTTKKYLVWKNTDPGKSLSQGYKVVYGRESWFNVKKAHKDQPLKTITTVSNNFFHSNINRILNKVEYLRAFGLTEDFLDDSKIPYKDLGYIVPPIFYEKLIPEVLKFGSF